MAFSTSSVQQSNAAPALPAATSATGDASMMLLGALAGVAMTKEARRQYKALSRKMAWQALGLKFKGIFNKKYRAIDDKIGGIDSWLFILLVVAAAALGIALFGIWGFIVILALGAIIYLLLQQSK